VITVLSEESSVTGMLGEVEELLKEPKDELTEEGKGKRKCQHSDGHSNLPAQITRTLQWT
jgi:hypothetical protein